MTSRVLLACLALSLAAPAAQAADPLAAGRAAFQRCANCHQVGPGARSHFGPQLNGILGRRAGAAPDFDYSPALRKAGFTWNDKNLAAFLRDPDAVVPGNKMRFWGLRSERQIADLLAYLRAHPAPAASARR
ncbi:c-type cytochrome [Massilia sp.]|uniref:c-type cytochrome n=1 Tax=Massilia sp. TaxID=1882437 RepID=UPI00391D0F76